MIIFFLFFGLVSSYHTKKLDMKKNNMLRLLLKTIFFKYFMTYDANINGGNFYVQGHFFHIEFT